MFPKRGTVSTAIVLAAGLAMYALIYPYMMSWGATQSESSRVLAGDKLVKGTVFQSTQAITINAPIGEVWPWVVQMGQDKGGFYSYDFLENSVRAGIYNAERIHPEWQQLAVGDPIRPVRKGYFKNISDEKTSWYVADIKKNRSLVILDYWEGMSWSILLEPGDGGTTRLIHRMRFKAKPGLLSRTAEALLGQPVHYIMDRGVLLGTKLRVERPEAIRAGHMLDLAWFVTCLLSGLGIATLVFSKKWPQSVLAASVGTIFFILLTLVGTPSALFGAVVAIALLQHALYLEGRLRGVVKARISAQAKVA